jgi:hypothetical protein
MAPAKLQLQLAVSLSSSRAIVVPRVLTGKGTTTMGRHQPPRPPLRFEMPEAGQHCARGVCAVHPSSDAQAVVPMLPVGRPPPPLHHLVQPLPPLLGAVSGSSGRGLL